MDDNAQSRLTKWVTKLVYLQQKPRIGGAARTALWMLGIDIPKAVQISAGLRLSHPSAGIVVHPSTRIGPDVTLFHGVTLGRSNAWQPEESDTSGGIEIRAGAVVCAGAVILFRPGKTVVIGKGSVVGANSVVTNDIPDGEVWAGNPAMKVQSR